MIKSHVIVAIKRQAPTIAEIERSVDDRWVELVEVMERNQGLSLGSSARLLGWVARGVQFIAIRLRIEGHNNA